MIRSAGAVASFFATAYGPNLTSSFGPAIAPYTVNRGNFQTKVPFQSKNTSFVWTIEVPYVAWILTFTVIHQADNGGNCRNGQPCSGVTIVEP